MWLQKLQDHLDLGAGSNSRTVSGMPDRGHSRGSCVAAPTCGLLRWDRQDKCVMLTVSKDAPHVCRPGTRRPDRGDDSALAMCFGSMGSVRQAERCVCRR